MIPGKTTDLCITTDAVVEGVHFTLQHFSFEDIGHKALAVNLSDLAAMGATPRWFVCAIAHPRGFSAASLHEIATGMSKLAKRAGISLVGGNFTSASELSITVTAAGEVPRKQAVTRSGASAGDRLFVTGTLGAARLGLEILHGTRRGRALIASGPATAQLPLPLRTRKPGAESTRRQLRPQPRLDAAPLALRFASAGLDVSDGLVQDLGHLCEASSVGARILLENLPIDAALSASFARIDDARLYAAAGGEDYELLLAVRASRVAGFRQACKRARVGITEIGEIVQGSGVELVAPSGKRVPLPRGYDHFQGDRAG